MSAARSSEQYQRAYFLLSEALDLDEEGKTEDALEAYSQAVELCISAKSDASDGEKKKLNQVATQALDRAEVLKKSLTSSQPKPKQPSTAATVRPAFDLLHIQDDSSHSRSGP